MTNRILTILLIFVLGIGALRSQHLYDSHFVMGYWSDTGYKDPIIHFTKDSVRVVHEKLAFGFILENSNISSSKGHLLYYFNGCELANWKHQIIENGTGFNPGRVAMDECKYKEGYASGQQSMLSLPIDTIDNKFILFHERVNVYSTKDSLALYSDLNFSIIDMGLNQGNGRVILKNVAVLKDTIIGSGNLTAVKHKIMNDWWIIKQDYRYTNRYYKILLSKGTVMEHSYQEIGNIWKSDGASQTSFSSDGSKYLRYSGVDGLYIMDFDRDNGMFSNFRHLPTTQEALFSGACFSPSGRYVYIGNGPYLYQVDVSVDSLVLDTIAEWDGSIHPNFGQPNWFGQMQIGPDCRIYGNTGFCLPYMHVIMHPDEKGKACDVRQHMIELQTPVCNLPHFPNYRLDTPYPFCNPEIVVLTGTDYNIPTKINEKSLDFIPNPGADQVTILIPGSMIAPVKYNLVDLAGRSLISGLTFEPSLLNIDTHQLPLGMYTISLIDKSGILKTGKWVKNYY